MEIHLRAMPQHMYPIPTPCHILVMQRLVQVANKVNNKLGRNIPVAPPQRGIERLLGIVRKRCDDAAGLLAIALEVDVARSGRVVLGVDEVEGFGEAAPAGVADGIGPGGDVGHVVGGFVVEEVFEVGFGGVGDEFGGEVGGGDVTQTLKGFFVS